MANKVALETRRILNIMTTLRFALALNTKAILLMQEGNHRVAVSLLMKALRIVSKHQQQPQPRSATHTLQHRRSPRQANRHKTTSDSSNAFHLLEEESLRNDGGKTVAVGEQSQISKGSALMNESTTRAHNSTPHIVAAGAPIMLRMDHEMVYLRPFQVNAPLIKQHVTREFLREACVSFIFNIALCFHREGLQASQDDNTKGGNSKHCTLLCKALKVYEKAFTLLEAQPMAPNDPLVMLVMAILANKIQLYTMLQDLANVDRHKCMYCRCLVWSDVESLDDSDFFLAAQTVFDCQKLNVAAAA